MSKKDGKRPLSAHPSNEDPATAPRLSVNSPSATIATSQDDLPADFVLGSSVASHSATRVNTTSPIPLDTDAIERLRQEIIAQVKGEVQEHTTNAIEQCSENILKSFSRLLAIDSANNEARFNTIQNDVNSVPTRLETVAKNVLEAQAQLASLTSGVEALVAQRPHAHAHVATTSSRPPDGRSEAAQPSCEHDPTVLIVSTARKVCVEEVSSVLQGLSSFVDMSFMKFLSPSETPMKEHTLQLSGDERSARLRVDKILANLKLGPNKYLKLYT